MTSKRYGCAAATLGDEFVVVMGGHDGTEETDSVEFYHGGYWMNNVSMRSKRLGCVATTLSTGEESESIVVAGGHDGQSSLHTVERYNPRLGMWTILPPMQTSRRFDFGAASIGSCIYVAGGHDGKSCTNTVEMFGTESSRWASVLPMREKRFQCSATAVGNKIYIVGGDNGERVLDSCEVYDTVVGAWFPIAPMKRRRRGCAAVTVDGCIYVFGGHDGKSCLNTAEKYDPVSNSWSWLPSMKYRRLGAAVAVLDQRVYIVGGFDGTSALDSVEQFTLNSSTETLTGESNIAVSDAVVENNEPAAVEASVSLALRSTGSPVPEKDVPNELICPITGDIMVDPVVASDGHSYEREAIEEWFRRFPLLQKPRSPKTNATVERILFPNQNLKSLCRSTRLEEKKDAP